MDLMSSVGSNLVESSLVKPHAHVTRDLLTLKGNIDAILNSGTDFRDQNRTAGVCSFHSTLLST